LVGAPATDILDILAAVIEILRNRIAAGTTTFLVKVKAHQGKPVRVISFALFTYGFINICKHMNRDTWIVRDI